MDLPDHDIEVSKPSPLLRCDGCSKVIQKLHYKCPTCPNWDYCEQCHRRASLTHPMHTFTAHENPNPVISTLKTNLDLAKATYISPYVSDAEKTRRSLTTSFGDEAREQQIFEYTPLTGQYSFRLLALMPKGEDDKVECKMVHVNLDNDLDFEALSYAWGNKAGYHWIYVEHLGFPVSPALHDALLQLRPSKDIRYVWIDALCIDQIDDAEKGVQVQQMRAIYSKARQVLFWLGTAADNSDHAIDVVHGAMETEGTHEALGCLFGRPCWNRVWCLQELAVPQNPPLVMCGSKTVCWNALHDYVRSRTELPVVYPLVAQPAQPLDGIASMFNYSKKRTYIQDPRRTPRLCSLMQSIQELQASDPRDYVYALVGLAHDAAGFVIDYSEDVNQVYIRAARMMIESSKSLNILCYNTNYSTSKRLLTPVPTWVPDWTMGYRERPPPILQNGLYRTSKNYEPSVSFEDDRLIVGGIAVERIESVSGVFNLTDSLSNLIEVIAECEALVEGHFGDNARPEHFSTDDCPDPRLSDSFWRTLICDRVFRRYQDDQNQPQRSGFTRASKDFGTMFQILLFWYGVERNSDTEPALQELASAIPADFRADLVWHDRIEQYITPLTMAIMVLNRRQFFVTGGGMIGVALQGIKAGDLVTVLLGSDMPIILRARNLGEPLRFVGEAYVDGLMQGQALDLAAKYGAQLCKFVIR